MSSCVKHPMAVSEHVCGRCGHEFCQECVVFPHGLRKPPLCITCALEAGGVRRQHTGRPRFNRREVKSRLHAHDELVAYRAGETAPAPAVEPEAEPQFLEDSQRAEELGGWSQTYPAG
jgi:hypothetical protein